MSCHLIEHLCQHRIEVEGVKRLKVACEWIVVEMEGRWKKMAKKSEGRKEGRKVEKRRERERERERVRFDLER